MNCSDLTCIEEAMMIVSVVAARVSCLTIKLTQKVACQEEEIMLSLQNGDKQSGYIPVPQGVFIIISHCNKRAG